MLALLDGRDYFADVFTVLDEGVPNLEIFQGNLVSKGYVLERRELECGPAVKGYASSGLRSTQVGDGHADTIMAIMYKEIGHFHLSLSTTVNIQYTTLREET